MSLKPKIKVLEHHFYLLGAIVRVVLIPFRATPPEHKLSGLDRDEADSKLMEARKDARRGGFLHKHPIVADE